LASPSFSEISPSKKFASPQALINIKPCQLYLWHELFGVWALAKGELVEALYAVVVIVLYFGADKIFDVLECRRGVSFEHRSIIFSPIFLA